MLIHENQSIKAVGVPIQKAKAAMLMLHGRGATADNILGMVNHIGYFPVAYSAPQAANFSWYPHAFTAEFSDNEPHFSSALDVIASIITNFKESGIPAENIIIMGFSQGACLALEFVARSPERFGAVMAFSGGLMGPEGTELSFPGSLADTPILMGCGDEDEHIPLERYWRSVEVMKKMGGDVRAKFYPGLGHQMIDEEIHEIGLLMEKVING